MSIFLAIALTVLPFYSRLGTIFVPYSFARDMLFLAIAVGFSVVSRQVDSRKSLPVLVLLVFAYFNQFQPLLTTVLMQFLPFLGGLLLISGLNGAKIEEKHVKIAAICTSFLGTLYLFCNYFGIDPMSYFWDLWYFDLGRFTKTVVPVGSLAHPIPSSVLITCLVPFSPWIIPMAIAALWITQSATAFVTLLVALTVTYGWRIPWRYWPAILFGCLPGIVWLYYLGFFEPSERFTKWAMIPGFVTNPIYGHGLGYFREHFWRISGGAEKWFHAHNELLSLYVSFGIVGIIAVGYLLSLIRVNSQNIRYFACFMSLVASSMFYFTFHNTPLVLWTIVCYSVLTVKEKR